MYFALLLATTLGAGLILHGLVSLLSLAAWRVFRARIDSISPRIAARLLLTMRMAPFTVSALFLAVFVIPAFLEYEPRTTIEPLSFTLLSLAVVFTAVLSGSVVRALVALLQSHRVMRAWSRNAQPQAEIVQGVSFFRCESGTPLIAVMGLWHTRIFASRAVIDALTPEELQAALRHEAVHVRHFDILKKMFLQLAPTFLPGVDILKPVAAHWSRTCELSADEESVAGDHQTTVDLASALVKVARLGRRGTPAALPTLSAALAQPRESLLGCRVKRLLEISEHPEVVPSGIPFDLRKATLLSLAVLTLVIAAYPQALDFTHELLEFLVQG